MANKTRKEDKFPPGAYIALVGKRLLTAFRDGHRPTRDISLAQLKELAHFFNDAAAERRAYLEDKNLIYNGGIQHASVTLDRAQIAFLVACAENFQEPQSCGGLVTKLTQLRDTLIGDVEEDESAPLMKDGAVIKYN